MELTFKYIITNTGAILFNEITTHIQVAKGFLKDKHSKVLSAGFCTITYSGISQIPEIRAYGESSSLKIESQPELDKLIISDLFKPISALKYNLIDVCELYFKKSLISIKGEIKT